MPNESLMSDSIRKAAILVSALDRDSADALLDKMGPEQAARVRNAVFELEVISDEEQDAIVREFVAAGGGGATAKQEFINERVQQDGASRLGLDEFGEGLGHRSAVHSSGHTQDGLSHDMSNDADLVKRQEPIVDNGPFPILREASIETLANHLVHENAQVIAVVVAHLPPRRAAELIAQLAPRQQADVLRRVAALDTAAPAAIEILSRQLEAKLTEEAREQRNRTAGVAAVNSILAAAGDKRQELLGNLVENDQQLSQMVAASSSEPSEAASGSSTGPRDEPRVVDAREEPRVYAESETVHPVTPNFDDELAMESHDDTPEAEVKSDFEPDDFAPEPVSQAEPLVFEQLADFDDKGLAILFRETDPEITLVALAGASPEFVQRVMQPLPPREARTLRRKMERLGPIRLSDIAAAQREVARTASRLSNDGNLPPLTPRRFAVAA